MLSDEIQVIHLSVLYWVISDGQLTIHDLKIIVQSYLLNLYLSLFFRLILQFFLFLFLFLFVVPRGLFEFLIYFCNT